MPRAAIRNEAVANGERFNEAAREMVAENAICTCANCVNARLIGRGEDPIPTRECPRCHGVFPATPDYFYMYPRTGRLEYCTDAGSNCHATYFRERSARRRRSQMTPRRRALARNFGVEIEFEGDRDAVSDAAARLGLESRVESYGHRVTGFWRVITDGSVGYGGEAVSPPMSGADGRREVRTMCKAIREAGAGPSASTGLHVHHDVSDLSLEAFQRLFRFWFQMQPTIDMLVSRSRRSGGGCSNWCEPLTREYLSTIEGLSSIAPGTEGYYTLQNFDRYHGLNADPYPRQGTVEIRLHQGTADAKKINAWVEFGQAIIEWATSDDDMPAGSLEAMLACLVRHGLRQRTSDYLKRRAVELDDPDDETLLSLRDEITQRRDSYMRAEEERVQREFERNQCPSEFWHDASEGEGMRELRCDSSRHEGRAGDHYHTDPDTGETVYWSNAGRRINPRVAVRAGATGSLVRQANPMLRDIVTLQGSASRLRYAPSADGQGYVVYNGSAGMRQRLVAVNGVWTAEQPESRWYDVARMDRAEAEATAADEALAQREIATAEAATSTPTESRYIYDGREYGVIRFSPWTDMGLGAVPFMSSVSHRKPPRIPARPARVLHGPRHGREPMRTVAPPEEIPTPTDLPPAAEYRARVMNDAHGRAYWTVEMVDDTGYVFDVRVFQDDPSGRIQEAIARNRRDQRAQSLQEAATAARYAAFSSERLNETFQDYLDRMVADEGEAPR